MTTAITAPPGFEITRTEPAPDDNPFNIAQYRIRPTLEFTSNIALEAENDPDYLAETIRHSIRVLARAMMERCEAVLEG